MFIKTTEISLKRFYNIMYKVWSAVLFCFMLCISIMIVKLCRESATNGDHFKNYIVFVAPHVLNLVITVFVIILFIGDLTLLDYYLRVITDSVIIYGILSLMYYYI